MLGNVGRVTPLKEYYHILHNLIYNRLWAWHSLSQIRFENIDRNHDKFKFEDFRKGVRADAQRGRVRCVLQPLDLL